MVIVGEFARFVQPLFVYLWLLNKRNMNIDQIHDKN
jgi:hypothetical protein